MNIAAIASMFLISTNVTAMCIDTGEYGTNEIAHIPWACGQVQDATVCVMDGMHDGAVTHGAIAITEDGARIIASWTRQNWVRDNFVPFAYDNALESYTCILTLDDAGEYAGFGGVNIVSELKTESEFFYNCRLEACGEIEE